MTEKTDPPRRTALAIIDASSEQERAVLLNWANQVLSIRASSLSTPQKLSQIERVTKELGMAKPLLSHIVRELRRVTWEERSRPMRGVIGGAGIGLLASLASPMAGIAAFGGAIAVPVVLLGAGAGAVLVAIVDELSSAK